jgi:hypothetical protein
MPRKGQTVNPKENVLRMVSGLPDDATYEQMLENIDLLRAVENAAAEIQRGEGTDHDEFFDQLEAECDENIRSFERVKKLRETVSAAASVKEQIRALADSLDGQATFETVIYEIGLLQGAKTSRAELAAHLGIPIEEVLDHMAGDDEEVQDSLVRPRKSRASKGKGLHRQGRARNGKEVRKPTQAVRTEKA